MAVTPEEQAMIVSQDAWGRIVALLAAADGDIAGAEEALAAALEKAVRTWPVDGVPDNPQGWLYRVARNARRDVWKSAAARTSVAFSPSSTTVPPSPRRPTASMSTPFPIAGSNSSPRARTRRSIRRRGLCSCSRPSSA